MGKKKAIFDKVRVKVFNNKGKEVESSIINKNEVESFEANHQGMTFKYFCCGNECSARLVKKYLTSKNLLYFSSSSIRDHESNCEYRNKAKKKTTVRSLINPSEINLEDFFRSQKRKEGLLLKDENNRKSKAETKQKKEEDESIEEFKDSGTKTINRNKLIDLLYFIKKDCDCKNGTFGKDNANPIKDFFYISETREQYKGGELEIKEGSIMCFEARKTSNYSELKDYPKYVFGDLLKYHKYTIVLVDDFNSEVPCYFLVSLPTKNLREQVIKKMSDPAKNGISFVFIGKVLKVDDDYIPGKKIITVEVSHTKSFKEIPDDLSV